MKEPLDGALERLHGARTIEQRGRVTALTGLVLRATLPRACVGDCVTVRGDEGGELAAEVVGFRDGEVLLLPLGPTAGVGPGHLVQGGSELALRCGAELRGRVLDGLGRPLDGSPPPTGRRWPVERPAPAPLARPRIERPLALGVRAVDGLLTVGEGQRIGLFAGAGVGKSTLLGQIARNTDADLCVLCLVGERGREVRELIDEALGDGLARAVVVCATSDTPPMVRLKAPRVATAVAEYFREVEGARVLLLMDSLTRYARALREVGLAAGEPPARRGYPPSVFAELPRLLERAGTSPAGSITAVYTVLVEGGDLDEPIADEVRGVLDGHIVLSRQLAERGHWPAIDVLQSLSRVMGAIVDGAHQRAARRLRRLLGCYERQRDLILLGAYERGSDADTDEAIAKIDAINVFLQQAPTERVAPEETVEQLLALV